jgi:hypothetical protein
MLERIPWAIRAPFRYRLLAANSVAAERDPLDPRLLRELREEFAPKVAALGDLIGRDLSAWGAVPSYAGGQK